MFIQGRLPGASAFGCCAAIQRADVSGSTASTVSCMQCRVEDNTWMVGDEGTEV